MSKQFLRWMILTVFLVLVIANAGARPPTQTTYAAVSEDGEIAHAVNSYNRISFDGRYVAFVTLASNLVDGVSGLYIYLRDMQDNTIEAIAPISELNRTSVAFSPEGNYMLFSTGLALDSDDRNRNVDVYIYHIESGDIRRVPRDNENGDALVVAASYQACKVLFRISNANTLEPTESGLYIYDMSTNSSKKIEQFAAYAAISADGERVAYVNFMTDEVHLLDTTQDLLAPEMALTPTVTVEATAEATAEVTAEPEPPQIPYGEIVQLSADGHYLVIRVDRRKLVVYSIEEDAIIREVGLTLDGMRGQIGPNFSLTVDGNWIVFSTIEGLPSDGVYAYNIENDTLEELSLLADGSDPAGGSNSARVSGNGQYVTFATNATDYVDIEAQGLELTPLFGRDDGEPQLAITNIVYGEYNLVAPPQPFETILPDISNSECGAGD